MGPVPPILQLPHGRQHEEDHPVSQVCHLLFCLRRCLGVTPAKTRRGGSSPAIVYPVRAAVMGPVTLSVFLLRRLLGRASALGLGQSSASATWQETQSSTPAPACSRLRPFEPRAGGSSWPGDVSDGFALVISVYRVSIYFHIESWSLPFLWLFPSPLTRRGCAETPAPLASPHLYPCQHLPTGPTLSLEAHLSHPSCFKLVV